MGSYHTIDAHRPQARNGQNGICIHRFRYIASSTTPTTLPMIYERKSQTQAIFAPPTNPINMAIRRSPPPIHSPLETNRWR